jgi:hypothetical protein
LATRLSAGLQRFCQVSGSDRDKSSELNDRNCQLVDAINGYEAFVIFCKEIFKRSINQKINEMNELAFSSDV